MRCRVAALPTLPFITSSVSATLEHEGGDHTDSVTGANLRTIGVSQRCLSSQPVPRRLTDRIRQEILTVVSEASGIRQDCDTIHQVSISMLLSRHFDGGTSSKVKYCFMSDFGTSMGVSWFGFSWYSSYSSASNWTVEFAFSSSAMNKCTNALTVSNSLYSFWGRTSGASIEATTLTMDCDSCKEDRAQGYTHIHFGAIRLALIFLRRKSLPAYSRIALLDTSCLEEAEKVDDDEDPPKKRKSLQQKLKRRYEKGDPTVRILGEPLGKFDHYDLTLPKHAWHASWHGHGSTKRGKGTFAWNLGHQENPNQETPTEFPKSDIKQHFTFDDVPPLKWRERSIEMLTWCTAEFQYYAIGQDDEPRDSVLCMIAYSDFSSDEESDSDSLDSDSDFGFHIINPIPHVLPIQEDPLLPLAKIHLLIDVYAKPIPIIAFFDTGSSVSILNPNILLDVNPTKASHPRLNLDHYQLAKDECDQLVAQGIIEPTTSPCACEAFYVYKISEQVRGKLRLVINYQPLNHFFADDKFPLAQKKSLFHHLADAKVLSKFDLKSGFWQLDEQSHVELLSKFYSLVTKYGIMLSEKKIEVGVTTIQFLGIEIFDGKYQPQPHVAQELLKLPDKLSSQEMI
ncbi:hypothetical protein Tco_0762702 [Tanacetum coccineum]